MTACLQRSKVGWSAAFDRIDPDAFTDFPAITGDSESVFENSYRWRGFAVERKPPD
jgi:hypothetical protein